jgi:hypothetical protein
MATKAVGDVAEIMSSPPKLSAAELIVALQIKDGIIITRRRRSDNINSMEPKILSFDSRAATATTMTMSETMGSPTTITIHPLPPTPPKPKSRTPPLKNPNEVDWRSKSQRDRLREVGRSYLSKKAAADVTAIKSDPPLRPPLMNQAASVSGRRTDPTDPEAYHLDEAAKQLEEAAASMDHMIRSTTGSGVGIPVHKELLSKNVQRNPLQQQNNRQPKEAKASTAMKGVSCVPSQRKGIALKDVTNSMRNDNISQKSTRLPGKTNTKLNHMATIASRRSNSKSQGKTQPEAGKDLKSTTTADINDFESSIGVLPLDTHGFVYDNTPDSSFGTDVRMFVRGKHTFAYDTAHIDSPSKSESDCSVYEDDSHCSSYNTEAESCFYTESSYGESTVKSTISTPQVKNSSRNHDYYDDDDDDDFVAEPGYNLFSPVHNIIMERDKATGSDHRNNNVGRSRSFFACFDFDEIRLAICKTDV